MNEPPLDSVRELIANLVGYIPALLAGCLVLLLGFVVGWIGAKLVVRMLILSRLDRVIGRLSRGRALEKGDVRHSLFELIGTVIGVLIFLVFLDNAAAIWRLTVLSRLLERLVLFAPQLLTAIIILLIGGAVASAVARTVQRVLVQEEFARALLVGRIVHAAIMVVAAAIALVELKIAVGIVTGAFLLAFGALALGFMLAFGLGSRKAVETMWEERIRRNRERREGETGGDSDPPPAAARPDHPRDQP